MKLARDKEGKNIAGRDYMHYILFKYMYIYIYMNMGRKDGGLTREAVTVKVTLCHCETRPERTERIGNVSCHIVLGEDLQCGWKVQVTTDFGSHTKEFELYLLGIGKSKK